MLDAFCAAFKARDLDRLTAPLLMGEGGVPLVLLHGGGSTIDVTYGRVLPLFAPPRTVIAVEEQGHGRTSDRDAPVRFDTSADDVAALLGQLRVESADFMGFAGQGLVG